MVPDQMYPCDREPTAGTVVEIVTSGYTTDRDAATVVGAYFHPRHPDNHHRDHLTPSVHDMLAL